jgi:hypothetical protein
VYGKQFLDCFDLDNNFLFYKQVEFVSAIKPYCLVNHGQWLLFYCCEPGAVQFKHQTSLIGGFQKSWPKMSMHFYGSTETRREI